MNLVDMLAKQLGGKVVSQIGKSVGLDETTTKTAVGTLVPTILGGLLKQVTTPGGADQLNQTLESKELDGSIFDNPGGLLFGDTDLSKLSGGRSSMIFVDKGSMIISILGKLTGMESAKLGAILSMMLPLVLSFLGKQKRNNNLDASGLTSLLKSQALNIAAALPAGMAEGLGLADLLAQHKPTPSIPTRIPTGSGTGWMTWLIALVVIAALGFVVWKFFLFP